MKSLKEFLVLILCAVPLFLNAQSISISGKVAGVSSGTMLLIAQPHESQFDTICAAPFNNGYFKMITTLSEPQALRLAVKGYAGGFTLLAEPNAAYSAHLQDGALRTIWGAPLQDAYNNLQAADSEKAKVLEQLKARYDSLKQAGKFRSASRVNDSISMLQTMRKALCDSVYAANDNLLPAHNTWANVQTCDKLLDECRSIYNALGTGAKASLSGRLLKERIDRLAKTEQGRPAPDFELIDINGDALKMSEVKAKLKIIDFWASWCGPCRLNNPSLKRLYEECHAKGLEIIAVSLDEDKTAWKAAVDKQALPWLHVSSLKGWKCPVAQQYSVTAVPAMFVLDENNRIVATQLRGESLDNFVKERLGLSQNVENE